MARDYSNQHIANYGGFVHDFGYVSFVTTGTTLEIDTLLTKVNGASLTYATDLTTLAETLNVSETMGAGGITVGSDGKVQIQRTVEDAGTPTSAPAVFYHFIGID